MSGVAAPLSPLLYLACSFRRRLLPSEARRTDVATPVVILFLRVSGARSSNTAWVMEDDHWRSLRYAESSPRSCSRRYPPSFVVSMSGSSLRVLSTAAASVSRNPRIVLAERARYRLVRFPGERVVRYWLRAHRAKREYCRSCGNHLPRGPEPSGQAHHIQ